MRRVLWAWFNREVLGRCEKCRSLDIRYADTGDGAAVCFDCENPYAPSSEETNRG